MTTNDREEYLQQIHEYLGGPFVDWLSTMVGGTPRSRLDSREFMESVQTFLSNQGIRMPLGCIRTIVLDNEFCLKFMDIEPEKERKLIEYGFDFV